MLFRLHGELCGGGGEEAMTVWNSLVCRREPFLEHHLAWRWSQWEDPQSLIATHRWYLRRGAALGSFSGRTVVSF